MAWPEGDVFPDGWSNASPMGAQWYVDTDVYFSAASSLTASASSFDSARLVSPGITLAAPGELTFMLRLAGSTSGEFTVGWYPDGGALRRC